MATREEIRAEMLRRYDEGGLSEKDQATLANLLREDIAARLSGSERDDVADGAEETAEVEGGGGFNADPVRSMINLVTGDNDLKEAAMHQGARTFDEVDEKVKGLRELPELFTLRAGGDHQVQAGKKFLQTIGMPGFEDLGGDDQRLVDYQRRAEEITNMAGSMDDPKALRKLIDQRFAPYNVETEMVGDAVLINFDDPLTGKRHAAWANKPGFSGRDAMSLANAAVEAGSYMLGGTGILKGGRLAREVIKRRGRRGVPPVIRDPKTGRMMRNPEYKPVGGAGRKARREAKRAKRQEEGGLTAGEVATAEAIGISTTGIPGVGSAVAKGGKAVKKAVDKRRTARDMIATAAEEAAFNKGGLVASSAVGAAMRGGDAVETVRAATRAFSKIKRRDRELKQRPR